MNEIQKVFTELVEEEHFNAFLSANFSGREVEALKSNGTYDLIRDTFQYGYLKGCEETIETVKYVLSNKGK